jgi:hypothetical protein
VTDADTSESTAWAHRQLRGAAAVVQTYARGLSMQAGLGADAVDGIRAKDAMLVAELAQWEHIARSTAFDD